VWFFVYKVCWDPESKGVLLTLTDIENSMDGTVRPVFYEELDLLGLDRYWQYPHADGPLLWAKGRHYFYDGQEVATVEGGGYFAKPNVVVKLEDLSLEPVDVNLMVEKNKTYINGLTEKAMRFIEQKYKRFRPKVDVAAVSFSGGKDSMVLLDLVQRTLNPDQYVVVFNDTWMELGDTYKVVEETKKRWPQLNFYTARSEKNAETTWKEMGPPSRLIRWCCTVHKSAPTLLMLRTLVGKPSVRALVIEGVRREESQRRSVYSDVAIGYKHDTQTNIRPIMDWSSTEIYLYIFSRSLPLNRAYRFGLTRVGCSVCPFASGWSEYVIENAYSSDVKPLIDVLFEYASMFTKEKDDLMEFVSSGKWKSRASGSSLRFGKEIPSRSFNNESILVLRIKSPNEKWTEWAKAVGNVVMENDAQGQINVRGPSNSNSSQKILDFHIKRDADDEVITISGLSSDDKETVTRLGWAATKASYCTHCQACQVECPTGALNVTTTKVSIDQGRCIHCAECLWFGGKVCLSAKSLKLKEGANAMSDNRVYLTDYSGFGIREEWLRKLVEVGEKWSFETSGLGNKQFSGLRSWLKHAEIDISENGTLSLSLLRKLGPDSDLVWATIWTNLARNSQIVRWYISQVKWGSVVSKDDCVRMTAEYFPNHTERTRKNAVTALFELFNKSPIGTRLGIGVASFNGRQQRVEKKGWSKPLPEVILYSLYRFAEANSRYEFTLDELYNLESCESPYALFGLSQPKLMSMLRGVSLTKPDLVRVEFVRDLNNVYLNRDFSPKEVLQNVRLE